MARALLCPLLGALAAVALLAAVVRAQPAGVPAVVDRLLQGFAAADCPRRWQAIEEYTERMIGKILSYEEPSAEVATRLRERAPSAGAAVQHKVRMVSAFVDEARQAVARLSEALKSVDRSGTSREVAQSALPPLTKILDDPGETFLTRRLAASLIAESARKSPAARDAGWDQPVPRLLVSQDPTARLVGSIAAATGSLLPVQAPTKGQIIPELVRGLDAGSFAARYESVRALLEVSAQPVERLCVDPSDGASDRAAAVLAWQAWWEQTRAGSAGATIGQ